jgi:hypothetical protein
MATGPVQLNVRVDRPVESCEITPHVHLYQRGEKGQQNLSKYKFSYR